VSDETPARILVRLPNPIGDMVMCTPSLRALRSHWPEAHITAAGPGHAVPVLDGLPYIDEVIPLKSRLGRPELDGLRFDLALVYANSFSSALTAWLTRAKMRVGYEGGGRRLVLTHAVGAAPEKKFHRRPKPMVEFYFRVIETAGVPRGSHKTELVATEADQARAEEWLARNGFTDGAPIYGMHGGASFGPSKLWYPDRWAKVADALHERHGGRTILFCGPGEEATVKEIAAAANSPVASAVDDPIDLRLLKAIVKRLTLLVATDAGPRHFGPAFDIPTVCLIGATDPRFSNTNLQKSVVVNTFADCSPCHLKICPIDHRCMTRMSPEMVLAACERLL
jgi:heptosyltransferase-2